MADVVQTNPKTHGAMGLGVVLWLVGLCGCWGPTAVTPMEQESAQQARPAMPVPLGVRSRPSLAVSPSKEVFGLVLGQNGHDAIDAWLTARGLHCGATPAPRRKTVHYRCMDVPSKVLGQRTGNPKGALLILARPDDGPLHHVSTLRRYSEPELAIGDYTNALGALVAELGKPTDADAAPPQRADFDAKAARFRSRWLFSDLEVELSLYRLSGPDIVVRQRWDVPGVEDAVKGRGNAAVHAVGGGPHSPHGIVVPTGADSLPGVQSQ